MPIAKTASVDVFERPLPRAITVIVRVTGKFEALLCYENQREGGSSISSSMMEDESMKTHIKKGLRLPFAAVIALAGVVIISLIAGMTLMQEEITNLRGIVDVAGDVSSDDNKARDSTPPIEHASTHVDVTKRRHKRSSRVLKKRPLRCKSGCRYEENRITLCKRSSNDLVMFPNHLKHRTQEEAMKFLSKFETLLNNNCSPFLRYFLCSLVAPPSDGFERPTPPCKELCIKATKPCGHLLKRFGLKLPPAMRCSRLQRQGASKCYNGPEASKCLRMTIDRYEKHPCAAYVPPSFLQFPNYFGHMDAKTASDGFKRFRQILDISLHDCAILLSRFLCSLYGPTCRKTILPIPPCRELCQQSRTRCQRVFDDRRFGWPLNLNCQQFPRKGEAPCYEGPSTGVTAKPQPGKCQPLSIPFCKSVPYNMTTFPNFLMHTTQEDASLEVHQLWPLVDRQCSRDVELFFCSLYAPICTILDTPPLPCRELCLRVKGGCAVVLKVYRGSGWFSTLACKKFPRRGSGEVCVDRPQETSQLVIPQSEKRRGKCEALTAPMCKDLNYTMTMVPNVLNHTSQEQAASEIHPSFYFGLRCREMTLFVCTLYFPPCEMPYQPCREFCERVKRQRFPIFEMYGYPWPEDIDCDEFPPSKNGTNCIGASSATVPTTQPEYC